LEAEQALAELSQEGLETVVLRPPLVYGPGVKANFLALLQLCDSVLPLPLAAVTGNRRSFVYVDDLASAVRICLTHPRAAGRTYLVASGPPLSTATLVRELRRALGRPQRLLAMPPTALRLLGRLAGREDSVSRLLDSLAVDAGRIARELGWRSRWGPREGLESTVAWYREHVGSETRSGHASPVSRFRVPRGRRI
jgi:nucleoside-diphosphate-sugar epimerase